MIKHNPFIYGRSLKPVEFVGRRREIRTLFDRLINGESTAIVGEPHCGKSSLLAYLASPPTRHEWLGDDADRFLFVETDCHLLPSQSTPQDFWAQVLQPLAIVENHPELNEQLQIVQKSGFGSYSLERLFKLLAQAELHLVLLIDEFDALLHNAGFNSAEFLGSLRTLASRSGSLHLVTASRMDISTLNRRSQELNPYGSPFFNNFVEIMPGPLSQRDVALILRNGQEKSGVMFDDRDYAYLMTVGGTHPYRFQVAASALFDAISDDLVGTQRYEAANEAFYERSAAHFDDVWGNLDDNARTVLLILALVETGGTTVGKSFAFGEIERVKHFGPELKRLAKLGLAERVGEGWQFDSKRLLLWQDERWRLASQGFVWWVSDVVIAESRKVPKYTEWMNAKSYEGLLTHEQWQMLKSWATKVPMGAGGLMRLFVSELLKIRPPKSS